MNIFTTADPGRADLAVRARRLVAAEGERSGCVLVKDGRIVAIEAYDAPVDATDTVELADDEALLPGVVDTHVHVNEPGRTDWEGFASATRAGACGGTTTIIDMPLNSIPPVTTVEALHAKQEAARGQCRVDVGFWGGAVPENVGGLRPLWDAGVYGFKCFLAPSGVEEFGHLDAAQLRAHLAEIASFDGLMIVHAEDCALLEQAPAVPGPAYRDFLASRPDACEDTAINDVIAAARETGARVHILHLASASATPMLRRAKADGVRLTAETCPHYLTFAAGQIPDGATQYKCCPPIRDESNREALWAALNDGDIDYVASDHSPCTPDLKRLDVGDFALAWGGIASVELVLRAVWTGAKSRGGTLSDVVRWLSTRPAENVGLSRKGRIVPGYDADLCVFAPESSARIDVHQLHHKNPVTPYHGRGLFGEVRATYLRGRLIDIDRPAGELLARS